jgi:hypothetical protein
MREANADSTFVEITILVSVETWRFISENSDIEWAKFRSSEQSTVIFFNFRISDNHNKKLWMTIVLKIYTTLFFFSIHLAKDHGWRSAWGRMIFPGNFQKLRLN